MVPSVRNRASDFRQRCRKHTEDLLCRRLEIWHSTRSSRGETPADIWDSAVALARIYGVCQIARAVGLDYKALRTRVVKAPEKPGLVNLCREKLGSYPFSGTVFVFRSRGNQAKALTLLPPGCRHRRRH
jgi:hypothetical protein